MQLSRKGFSAWKELQKERFCGENMCQVFEESKRIFRGWSIVRKRRVKSDR